MAESMSDNNEIPIAAKKSEERSVEVWEHMTYTWVVKDLFSSFDKQVGFRLQSPVFPSNAESVYKWYISIFPNGKNEDTKGFVSLFLRLVSAPTDVFVRFKLSIKTTGDLSVLGKKLENVFPPGGLAWGWYRFMTLQDLMARLERDEIIVQAVIKIQLHDQEYKQRFSQNLAPLLENARFSDVILSVQGSKIPAHKNILAFRSKVFSDMFDKESSTSKSKYTKIPNLSLNIVQAMIRFMYSGAVDIPDINTATELIKAAGIYAIDDLKTTCFEYLISKLDVSNVIQIYCVADAYDEKGLMDYAMEYIYDHSHAIFENNNPHVLLADKPKLLDKIVARLVNDVPK